MTDTALPSHQASARAPVESRPPHGGAPMDHAHLAAAPQSRRRITLGELASRGSATIPSLARIMPDAATAGRVDRASFQSFSR